MNYIRIAKFVNLYVTIGTFTIRYYDNVIFEYTHYIHKSFLAFLIFLYKNIPSPF